MAKPQKTSTALTKRAADTALMPPPPAAKRIKRPTTVLEEDSYTSALSHIIARDFFPGLLESQTQEEFLNALDAKDDEWIAEAGRKVAAAMTPGPEGRRLRGRRGTSMAPGFGMGDETPRGWGGDTPAIVAASETASTVGTKEPEVDLNLSLSAFQAKYTSEDNESFNAMVDKQNNRRRAKNAWFWNGNKIPSARQIAYAAREAKLLEATTSPSASTDLILREKARDKRPAMIETKTMPPKNSFMFGPESIEDELPTRGQIAEAKSLAPPKAILHGNTRIPMPETENEHAIPASPSLSAIDAAIAGRPRPTESEAGYSGADIPQVSGYAFVDAEPTPAEIAFATGKEVYDPFALLKRITPADDTPNMFHIKESSQRENLHHRLVEKQKRNKLGRVGDLMGGETLGRTPTPKFLSAAGALGGSKKRKEDLTPAAQSLIRKIGTPLRSGSAWDRKSEGKKDGGWTPAATPKVKR
ncbi:hypothetical protein EJ08DRAFT_119571 [Tothia fuscella]|uniref:Nuclear protein DGCR14 n=1 Tax=Tothia fuscella TaxID=1048955 RepID=A0A9P4NDZ7_9PEZI|nr:hypothetical protein EJ08DRAFT_119571 [Tothia fuscella]